jgi:NDP-sugar pyrophosphorylase family protein
VIKHLKAVVLAGGFNTRLRPLSCTRPKILFPILNKPLLQWTYERLAKNHINNVVLAVFYQTEVYIKQHRVPRHGLHVTYSHDPLRKPLGTAGSIKKTEKQIGHDAPFLALNGDIFADVNYTQMLKQHEKNNCTATIALHEVQDPSRYGVAKLAKDNRITGFIEKPPPGTASSNLINAGAYVLSPKIFKYIPQGQHVSIERQVFPKLAEEKELYGYVHTGLWTDIGKPEDYFELNKTMLDNNGGQPNYKAKGSVQIKKPVAFANGITIGNQSTIGPYTVLGPKVTVGNKVDIKNSIILAGTQIADLAKIHGAIIGEDVYIGTKTHIRKGCIIGDHARIRDNVSLPAGTSICPANEVAENTKAANCNKL